VIAVANAKVVDRVILGLLSHESLTGYEIKKRMDSTLSFFWSASFGSIYPALRQLVQSGHAVASSMDTGGRGRVRYTITQQGRQALREWLSAEAVIDELHSETLLKIFLSDPDSGQTVLDHVRRLKRRLNERMPFLQQSVQTLETLDDGESQHLYYLLTARFGQQIYEAALTWCEQSEQLLQQQICGPSGPHYGGNNHMRND